MKRKLSFQFLSLMWNCHLRKWTAPSESIFPNWCFWWWNCFWSKRIDVSKSIFSNQFYWWWNGVFCKRLAVTKSIVSNWCHWWWNCYLRNWIAKRESHSFQKAKRCFRRKKCQMIMLNKISKIWKPKAISENSFPKEANSHIEIVIFGSHSSYFKT